MMMAIGVDFACDEGINEENRQNGKKVTAGGSNSRARTPVSVWPILATVVVPPTPHIRGLLVWDIVTDAAKVPYLGPNGPRGTQP